MTRDNWRWIMLAVYVLGFVVTTGAAWQSVQASGGVCARFGDERPNCAASIAPFAAVLWPFYWSVRLWS